MTDRQKERLREGQVDESEVISMSQSAHVSNGINVAGLWSFE